MAIVFALASGCVDDESAAGPECGAGRCEVDETCSLDVCVTLGGPASVVGWSDILYAKAQQQSFPSTDETVYTVTVSEHAACLALGEPSDGSITISFPGNAPLNQQQVIEDGISVGIRLANQASGESATTASLVVTALSDTSIEGTFSASFPSAGERSGSFTAVVCDSSP